jgi:hypothetical protein
MTQGYLKKCYRIDNQPLIMSYPNLSADTIATLTTFFYAIDTNSDGFISIDEIKAAEAEDLNLDGTISAEEIAACAAPWLNQENVQDLNNDQLISLAELLQFNNDHGV